jgi:hypothetical protein
MNTQLTQGAGKSPDSSGNGVFGVIASAIQQQGRKLGCWDASRFALEGACGNRHGSVVPDPTVTRETLAYAYATS